jgi:hypothetical protein
MTWLVQAEEPQKAAESRGEKIRLRIELHDEMKFPSFCGFGHQR